MKRKEFENIESLVISVLREFPITRDSDALLDAMIVQKLGYGNHNYIDVMSNRTKYGIPALSSIERIRRKVQETHSELKPSPEMQAVKANLEKDYIAYALNL